MEAERVKGRNHGRLADPLRLLRRLTHQPLAGAACNADDSGVTLDRQVMGIVVINGPRRPDATIALNGSS